MDERREDIGPGRKEYEGDRSADRSERLTAAAGLAEEVAERRKDPGPSGTEYEQFKREAYLRTRVSALTLFLTLVLATLAVVEALKAPDEEEAITVCESNRASIVAILERELGATRTYTYRDFPGFGREQFNELIDQTRADYRELIRNTQPEDCRALFHDE